MTYIPRSRMRVADVVRLVVTRNVNGDVIDESYSQIYGNHNVDLQPASNQAKIAAEQLKYNVSHRIYPERNIASSISLGDFYRIGSTLYKIVKTWDYIKTCYFEAWNGAFGDSNPSTTVFKSFYSIDGVGPGTYTFGSGIFSAVPSFDQAPDIVGLLTNDGTFYIDSVTATGFRLVDRGIGVSPLATIHIWEKPVGVTDVNRWSYTGIAPGTYTFGTSPFDDISVGSFTQVPIIMTQDNNDGSHFVSSKSVTGFTIENRFIGSTPSISVIIIRQ
jgi:hypothetical protein